MHSLRTLRCGTILSTSPGTVSARVRRVSALAPCFASLERVHIYAGKMTGVFLHSIMRFSVLPVHIRCRWLPRHQRAFIGPCTAASVTVDSKNCTDWLPWVDMCSGLEFVELARFDLDAEDLHDELPRMRDARVHLAVLELDVPRRSVGLPLPARTCWQVVDELHLVFKQGLPHSTAVTACLARRLASNCSVAVVRDVSKRAA